MNGNEVYEEQFKKKCEKLIEDNPDKPYLRGFYNFMNLKYTSRYSYLYQVVCFMDHNKKDVKDLCMDDYNEYKSLVEKNVSSYQITVYSALKKFSLYLYASKKNNDNPMVYVQRPEFTEGINTIKKREEGYLTEKEQKEYIKSVSSIHGSGRTAAIQEKWKERDVLLVKLFIYTGLRCSAMYKLNIENIDFENRKLFAVDKGGKVPCFVLSEEIIECINNWLIKRKDILGLDNKEQALFISNQKRRMDQRSMARVVSKYATDINGKHISPHKLRATCGTRLLEKSQDIYFVQEYLGHSSPKTTELYIRGQANTIMERGANIMSTIFE